MNIKPIKTEKDYDAALGRVEELFEARPNTPEGDELDVLITLVAAYEDKHHKIEAPDPIEAIRHMMEAQNLKPVDLSDVLGSRSRVSEVLNKKRKLSVNMIRSLNKTLNIPASDLIQEY